MKGEGRKRILQGAEAEIFRIRLMVEMEGVWATLRGLLVNDVIGTAAIRRGSSLRDENPRTP